MHSQAWLGGSSVVPASIAVVAGASVGFYILEQCSRVDCPFGHDVSGGEHPREFRSHLEPGAQFRAWKSLLQGQWGQQGGGEMYKCILQSQAASISLIFCTWAIVLLALLMLLSWVLPKPQREELRSFRNTSAVFVLQGAFMLSYVVAVAQEGYADVTSILLFWSFKFSSRQLSTLLPLRSTWIKRAHTINVPRLSGMLLAYIACTAAHTCASYLFWRHLTHLSPIVTFELWSVPLGILTFGHLTLLEGLHLAEEVSMRRVMQGHVPFITPDRRAELADYIMLAHGVGRGAIVFLHRIQMLRVFGIQWRLGDFVLLADARLNSQRVFKSIEVHLQNSVSHVQIDHHYATASPDEVEEVQNCAICHGALRQGHKRRLTMPKRLPCGHVFHLGCVRRWMIHSLGKEATCPMCRLHLPNALEARNTDCWQARAAAGIRWWLDWPRQHAVLLVRIASFFGNRLFPPPPDGLAEYMEGSQSDAASAAATVADAAQPPELRSRLRAVTMNSGADPDLARRMLEGYLTVRESLERREGLYTVIGHAESPDGTPVMPAGARAPRQRNGGARAVAHAPPVPLHGHPAVGDSGLHAAAAMERPVPASHEQGAGSGVAAGGDRTRPYGRGAADAPAGDLLRHGHAREHRRFQTDGDAAEATFVSELVAMALSSPLLGMLAAGGLEGPGGLEGDADASAGDPDVHQSQ
eukprot:jgi/Ulvmu1/10370/UM061_0053.1